VAGPSPEATEADDDTLIQGVLAGRRSDFDLLVMRHQRALYAFAWRWCRDHERAADVVQTTFLRAYQHLARFAGRASFRTWLLRIALNECRALHRAETAHPHDRLDEATLAAADAAAAAGQSTQEGDGVILGRSIERLPPRQRSVVLLRVFEDLPFKAIAGILGITENAAKVNYHHAITRLRSWLAEPRP